MEKLRKLAEKKGFKAASLVVKILLAIFFAAFVIVVFLQRFSNNEISFFNYRMFTVVSGSMEPIYSVGDVLISKEVNPSKIKVGDAVTYKGEAGDFKGKVITHQVVGISKNNEGKYLFRTKGTANIIEDPVVSESQIYGVIVYKTILLSAVYAIIGTKIGFYLFIIIPIMYVIGSEIISLMLEKEKKRRETLEK